MPQSLCHGGGYLELTSWDQMKLLTVQANRLGRSYRPGLLCIGDAAHPMSPVGGVGITFAIQDAVEAANRLAGPLLKGPVETTQLAAVQRTRGWQVRGMQLAQSQTLKGALTLGATEQRPSRLARSVLRAIGEVPLVRAWPPRLVALGFRRIRVRLAAAPHHIDDSAVPLGDTGPRRPNPSG